MLLNFNQSSDVDVILVCDTLEEARISLCVYLPWSRSALVEYESHAAAAYALTALQQHEIKVDWAPDDINTRSVTY